MDRKSSENRVYVLFAASPIPSINGFSWWGKKKEKEKKEQKNRSGELARRENSPSNQ